LDRIITAQTPAFCQKHGTIHDGFICGDQLVLVLKILFEVGQVPD
jgi:hypothetical protein